MANINELINQQHFLTCRLRYLDGVINALLKDDCTRHEHTINHYLRELENYTVEAELVNLQVEQIVQKATKTNGWERF
jgi:hypothetical protein